MKKILITGSAGFIGFHLVNRFLKDDNFDIVGLDNINDYYDVNLKFSRLDQHGVNGRNMNDCDIYFSTKHHNYRFVKADIANFDFIVSFMKAECFDYVVNLAAQAGVRNSILNPRIYIDSNIKGFLSILEGAAQSNVQHLIYASTSSVYGSNTKMPFSIHQNVDHPLSLYAATKKSNELMAHTYSYLYGLPTTGLRFFTVYGPWGRPDMALFKFTSAILAGQPIEVFNNGKHRRDFTYINDIIEGIIRVIYKPAIGNPNWDGNLPDPGSSSAPWRLYNIGNSNPVDLMDYVSAVEKALGKKAKLKMLPLQPGDVPDTFADVRDLMEEFDYKPSTPVQIGITQFVDWYRSYFEL